MFVVGSSVVWLLPSTVKHSQTDSDVRIDSALPELQPGGPLTGRVPPAAHSLCVGCSAPVDEGLVICGSK